MAVVPHSLVAVLLHDDVHFPQTRLDSLRLQWVTLVLVVRILVQFYAQAQRVFVSGQQTVGALMALRQIRDQGQSKEHIVCRPDRAGDNLAG